MLPLAISNHQPLSCIVLAAIGTNSHCPFEYVENNSSRPAECSTPFIAGMPQQLPIPEDVAVAEGRVVHEGRIHARTASTIR